MRHDDTTPTRDTDVKLTVKHVSVVETESQVLLMFNCHMALLYRCTVGVASSNMDTTCDWSCNL